MASIDLKDAYYSVPVAQEDRKYLKFQWADQLYQFTCLPNGLAEAPRKFTKLLKVPFAVLRSQGHESSAYLDDSALFGCSEDKCLENVQDSMSLLDSLGFTVHPEKSMLVPQHILIYLGFILNSLEMTVSPTPEKIQKVIHMCEQLLNKRKVKILELAEMVGTLIALEPGMELAPVFYRRLDIFKADALKMKKGSFEAKVHLTDECKQDLAWWKENAHTSVRHVRREQPDVVITSDSSDFAWGGTRDGISAGGPWSGIESTWHINVKELLAAYLTLKTFCDTERDVHIRLKVDNITSVAYLNKKGRRKRQLNEIARQIWLWAMERNVWLTAEHLPGTMNVGADMASRKQYALESEWQLDTRVFSKINEMFGPLHLDIFATRLNTQCKRYYAWKPDPGAIAIDAFAQNWHGELLYAFPPFSLIGQVLQKVEEERARAVLVLPLWSAHAWFARLLRLLVDVPWRLPHHQSLLRLPQCPDRRHALLHRMNLTVFVVSGITSEHKAFLTTLPSSSARPGGGPLRPSTIPTCGNGRTFVVDTRLITCRQMEIV